MKQFLFSGTLSKVTSSENDATDGMQEVDEDAGVAIKRCFKQGRKNGLRVRKEGR